MKVSEVKEIAPLADVYELSPKARYFIVADPKYVPQNAVRKLLNSLQQSGIQSVCCMYVEDGGIKFYEFQEEE